MVGGTRRGIESLIGKLWRAGPDLWSEQCFVSFYEGLCLELRFLLLVMSRVVPGLFPQWKPRVGVLGFMNPN